MTLDSAIQRTYMLASGKATAPASGTTKYVKITSLLNMYKDVWARQPNVQWRTLRAYYNVPTVVSTAQSYALGAIIENISRVEGDFVRVYWSNGINETDYNLVAREKLFGGGPIRNGFGSDGPGYASGNCSIEGSNIIFDKPFLSTVGEIGGTIKIPYYPVPADMVSGTDVVPVDDPDWICFMAAAEYVRNDVTKQNQYGNLIAQATDSYNGMFERNLGQIEESIQEWSPLGVTW